MIRTLVNAALRVLRPLDRAFNRLYGWRFNPLYQSGTLAVLMFVILLVTGVYLLLFYRIGSPWASVAAITDQAWGGRWIRTLHRYASDAAIVAIVIHAFRMFAQGRSWGPRALAWLSGVVLTGVFFICGWTGYVMVWDVHGQILAIEGARMLDVLPLFSEPLGRTFVGPEPLPGAFFFMNLFLHIVLPIGVGALLWLHLSRLARAPLMPPRGLAWSVTAILLGLSVLWPIGMAAPAAVLGLPTEIPLDVAYGFWVPISRALPGWAGWLVIGAGSAAVLIVPRVTRPKPEKRPEPSTVNGRFCTECYQCSIDCPYEAIRMVPREDGRFDYVAEVDPELCVSCGICAGSCKPMGVGPPGRTGRDQLERVRQFLRTERPGPDQVVVVACDRSADWLVAGARGDAIEYSVPCAGSVHTSAIELMLRRGAGGVAVVTCPPRDCWSREGVKWLEARVHGGREAELLPRVSRDRVRLINGAEPGLEEGLARFAADVRTLDLPAPEREVELDFECDPVPEEERPSVSTAR
ncbi:MAG: cytochrome b N-terminal domain-containing protein [Gemmatimonadetes bacterium]|nr:cytochrome b N-terminal domain-containing protein [Gemmatimonadota bacterium]